MHHRYYCVTLLKHTELGSQRLSHNYPPVTEGLQLLAIYCKPVSSMNLQTAQLILSCDTTSQDFIKTLIHLISMLLMELTVIFDS